MTEFNRFLMSQWKLWIKRFVLSRITVGKTVVFGCDMKRKKMNQKLKSINMRGEKVVIQFLAVSPNPRKKSFTFQRVCCFFCVWSTFFVQICKSEISSNHSLQRAVRKSRVGHIHVYRKQFKIVLFDSSLQLKVHSSCRGLQTVRFSKVDFTQLKNVLVLVSNVCLIKAKQPKRGLNTSAPLTSSFGAEWCFC